MKEKIKETPVSNIEEKDLPVDDIGTKETPRFEPKHKDIPVAGSPENTVYIGGELVEIKPTKLKYHRMNITAFYRLIEMYPIGEIVNMPAGVFGDDRDGDTALMEWMIAVTDKPELIRENYDDIDVETIDKMVSIYKRVNKIDEKEEKQKNAMSRAAEASQSNAASR